jgi:hypothetical protein
VVRFRKNRQNVFFRPKGSIPVLGPTMSPVHWGLLTFHRGFKWPESGAKHLRPSDVEVKNAWSRISTPPRNFMAYTRIIIPLNFPVFYEREPWDLIVDKVKGLDIRSSAMLRSAES